MIEVNGEISQRHDSTANWDYVNPILPLGQLGWEHGISVLAPVGVKMGDGITPWDDLPYYISTQRHRQQITVPAGSPLPFNVILDTELRNGFVPVVEMVLTSTKNRVIYDVIIEKIYTDSSKTQIASIDIIGHEGGSAGYTTDNLLITLYI